MDRLSPQSGLSSLFDVGRNVLVYDGFAQMGDLIRHYLADPDEALAIAGAAYRPAHERHGPRHRRRALGDLVFKATIDPEYRGEAEKRSTALRSENLGDLITHVRQYEYFQGQHLQAEGLAVLFWPGADARLACDLVDLPRLHVFWADTAAPPLFRAAETAAQIVCGSPEQLDIAPLDCLVADTEGSWRRDDLGVAVSRLRPGAILLTDWTRASGRPHRAEAKAKLLEQGYRLPAGRADPRAVAGLFIRDDRAGSASYPMS